MRTFRAVVLVLLVFIVVPSLAFAQEPTSSEVGNIGVYVGAGYACMQAVANLLMLFLPKNTVAFKISKWIIAGVSRQE